MDRRFIAALSAFAVLIGLALFTLSGNIRIATLLVLGLFAVKTILAELKKGLD